MMGLQQKQAELFSYQVNLEKRVRADHPLRKIERAVDFSFVRKEVGTCYGHNGNVSVDPVVIMKMLLLLFLDDVPSERELMAVIPERLDYLWFLGYGLDEEIPNHSVLSKARARWGQSIFEKLFVQTVLQCVEAGLVDGAKIHLDASLVRADASKDSVLTAGPELIAALKRAYATEEGKLEPIEGPYAVVNSQVVSTTDPDAGVVRQGSMGSQLCYKHHRAVDDAHGVVTAVMTTPGPTDEGGMLGALVDQHERNTECAVGTVVADSKYGTTENFRQCQARQMRCHMTDLQAKLAGSSRRKGIFREPDFHYDGLTDTYLCPAGERLKRRNYDPQQQASEYRIGRAEVCAKCKLRDQCTRAKQGRSLKRFADQEVLDRARAQSHSVAARLDRQRRKHLVEGSFADAANNHHFKRARWRRLWRQSIQDLLIATVQNIRILISKGGPLPDGAVAAVEASTIPETLPFSGLWHLFKFHRAFFHSFRPATS